MVNLHTASTDNPVILFIFLIYSLALCWGDVSNSNATIAFAQLLYIVFLSQNIRGTNDIMSPCPKVCGYMSSP